MQFPFESSLGSGPVPPEPPGSQSETADLLRQILEVQREQLTYLRASAAAHDMAGRWRAFLARWQEDFPTLGESCRKSIPLLEKTYGKLITDLTEYLNRDGEDDPLDTDFALQEFLDRFGMRLAQLGTILNLVAPLAEAGPPQGEAT
jgi:hypothetical protein